MRSGVVRRVSQGVAVGQGRVEWGGGDRAGEGGVGGVTGRGGWSGGVR